MALITPQQIYDVYILQSRNVRKLIKVKDSLVRDINRNVKRNNEFEVEIRTKVLSLVYSAWSEAQFVQILHTPSGFYPRIIKDIEIERSASGIIAGWTLMVKLAIENVGDINKSPDLLRRQNELIEIIKEYIEKQSIIRNKIAHGQWVHALNSAHTGESPYTASLNGLDYVQLEKLFNIHKYLGFIIRDLVQSPKKGFHANYWRNLIELESYLEKTKNWCIATKKRQLQKRPVMHDKCEQ